MVKYTILVALIGYVVITGCSSTVIKTAAPSTSTIDGAIRLVDFCDLPDYAGEKVYLKAAYRRTGEGWSLDAAPSARCLNERKVALEFQPGYTIPVDFKHILTEARNDALNSFLMIEAIGVYTPGESTRDGKSKRESAFLVAELVDLESLKNTR